MLPNLNKKKMIFIDLETINDPKYVTYKYQTLIATAFTSIGNKKLKTKTTKKVFLSMCAYRSSKLS